MKKRSGQAATEYIMIAAFALIVILPATYFFYTYSLGAQASIKDAQVNKLARDILTNAEKVHYLGGYPSLMTVDEQFPDNIRHMEIIRDWSGKKNELNFRLEGSDGVVERSYPTDVPLIGFYNERDWSGGPKKVRLIASYNASKAPFVLVDIGGECFISKAFDVNGNGDINNNDYNQCKTCFDDGGQLTGDCGHCDYNGNCLVDLSDSVLWKILARGNSPPTATISGPSAISGNAEFTITAKDIDGNLKKGWIKWYRDSDDEKGDIGNQCNLQSGETCSRTWINPDPGQYHVFPVIEDDDNPFVGKCTGNLTKEWGEADCGYDDYLTVTVTG